MSSFDDLLRLINLRCEIYHNHRLCGDWEVSEHAPGQTCFHLVSQGACDLEYQGQHWSLEAGDLILFPQEKRHRMRTLMATNDPMQRLPMSVDAEESTGLLCAEVRFSHRAAQAVLAGLPKLTIIRHSDPQTEWLQPIIDQIVQESQQAEAGHQAVLDHLAALLFMQAVRHAGRQTEQVPGVLKLHTDSRLVRALQTFHAAPEKHWSLSDLAEAAAMSRSRFAAEFRRLSGWTPGHYMTWWRMQLAWQQLSGGKSVLATALSVGYQSEAAFSRAFRKQFEASAGSVRRQRG